jgi:hypothetical protein
VRKKRGGWELREGERGLRRGRKEPRREKESWERERAGEREKSWGEKKDINSILHINMRMLCRNWHQLFFIHIIINIINTNI